MRDLSLNLNGRSSALTPAPIAQDERVLVPVYAFSELIGAEAEHRGGQLVVCRGDLCIPLLETVDVSGTEYVDIDDLAEPAGLRWSIDANQLRVRQAMDTSASGLGIGQRPPAFELPDMVTGEPVAMHDFAGKKAIFYMWASW
jgi:hypothetical protein